MSNLDSITPEYLLSEQYIKDMMTGYTDSYDTFISGIYDAEPKTQNYNIRHFQLVNKLGGWRWKGIFTYRETFIDLIFNKNLRGVDFGGSQRPIASHVDVVDIEDTDFYGRPVKYKTLEEVDYDLDFIFTSHTLEHIPDLDQTLTSMYDNLTKDGILAINIQLKDGGQIQEIGWVAPPMFTALNYLRQMLLTIPMREPKDMSLSLI